MDAAMDGAWPCANGSELLIRSALRRDGKLCAPARNSCGACESVHLVRGRRIAHRRLPAQSRSFQVVAHEGRLSPHHRRLPSAATLLPVLVDWSRGGLGDIFSSHAFTPSGSAAQADLNIADRCPMLTILTYHSIDSLGLITSVRPDRFAAQIAFLAEHQYQMLTIDEVVDLLNSDRPIP